MRPTGGIPGEGAGVVTSSAMPRLLASGIALALAAAGCADIRPYVPPSQGHISKPAAQPQADPAIPPPARGSEFIPPPKPTAKPQTYSVVVNEVPVKDLL